MEALSILYYAIWQSLFVRFVGVFILGVFVGFLAMRSK